MCLKEGKWLNVKTEEESQRSKGIPGFGGMALLVNRKGHVTVNWKSLVKGMKRSQTMKTLGIKYQKA